jgi:hypothetical protein
MRAGLAAGLMSIVVLLGAGAAAAQQPDDVKVPLRGQPGTTVRYGLDRIEETQKDGAAPALAGRQRSVVMFRVLGVRSDGFRMEMTYETVENETPRSKALGLDEGLARAIGQVFEGATLVFTTDLAGNPIAIENLGDVKRVLDEAMQTVRSGFFNSSMGEAAWKATERQLMAIQTAYAGMTQEQADQTLLEDVRPLFGLGDIDLPRDGEIQFQDETPWAMTGTMLTARSRLRLARLDDRQAVVELHTAFDRDGVRRGLDIALRQMSAKAGGPLPGHVVQTVRALENYDVIETQTTVLRRADGWADSVTLERRTIAGPERRTRRLTATRLE